MAMAALPPALTSRFGGVPLAAATLQRLLAGGVRTPHRDRVFAFRDFILATFPLGGALLQGGHSAGDASGAGAGTGTGIGMGSGGGGGGGGGGDGGKGKGKGKGNGLWSDQLKHKKDGNTGLCFNFQSDACSSTNCRFSHNICGMCGLKDHIAINCPTDAISRQVGR